jgi:catechol 2,3-dioxygenase-like lactoylglutathione lyase family enzyme
VDMKLEVVVVPVSDVDRAKRFYQTLGFRLDIAGENFRVVQLTPPGSESSIIIGKGQRDHVGRAGISSGSAPHRCRHRSVPHRTRWPEHRRGGGVPGRGRSVPPLLGRGTGKRPGSEASRLWLVCLFQ